MDKYCTECGEAIDESLEFCQSCGHKLHTPAKEDLNTAIPPKKQPKNYTKKQKIIMGLATALVVILIGGYAWGKSYFSPEKTAERFITAIIEEDYDQVQELTMMKGETISKAEAEALVTLAKEEAHYINIETMNLEDFTYQNDLMKLTENGKHLFIFPRYQFSLVPQYADLDLPFKDIETTFNEETFPAEEINEQNIVYGPLAPGKYKLHSSYSGELTEAESEEVLILGSSNGDTVYHSVQLDAESTTFELYNANNSPIKSAYLEVNEQQVPFDESMRIDAFGPLNLDGSVTATPIIETEWGKVTLEDIKIEEDYYELILDTVNKELMDNLSEVILLYGEEYVEAHAANDAKIYTTVTEKLRKNFQEDFSYNIDFEYNFTGQLDKIEINYDELEFYEENEVAIPVNFHFTASTFYSDEQPELEEQIDTVTLIMVFDSDKEKWLIGGTGSYSSFGNSDFKATETLKGSQKLHKAGKSASKPASKDLDEPIEETTLDYIYNLVEAINAGDYELVRPYIKDDSPLHGMQVDLVNRLAEKGTKQEVIEATVTDIEENGDAWIVTTDETIKIMYSNGKEETNDYNWNYTVESDGDGVSLTNIE